jgi:hypothetical protein
VQSYPMAASRLNRGVFVACYEKSTEKECA